MNESAVHKRNLIAFVNVHGDRALRKILGDAYDENATYRFSASLPPGWTPTGITQGKLILVKRPKETPPDAA